MPSLPLVKGRIRLRGDDGPTGELSEEKDLILYEGTFYELSCLTSTPGIQPHMVKLDIARTIAEDDGVIHDPLLSPALKAWARGIAEKILKPLKGEPHDN